MDENVVNADDALCIAVLDTDEIIISECYPTLCLVVEEGQLLAPLEGASIKLRNIRLAIVSVR